MLLHTSNLQPDSEKASGGEATPVVPSLVAAPLIPSPYCDAIILADALDDGWWKIGHLFW
jgi:hypothetical protein